MGPTGPDLDGPNPLAGNNSVSKASAHPDEDMLTDALKPPSSRRPKRIRAAADPAMLRPQLEKVRQYG